MQPSNALPYRLRAISTIVGLVIVITGAVTLSSGAHAQTPTTGGASGGPTPQTNGTLGSPTPANTADTQSNSGQVSLGNPLKYNNLNDLLAAVLRAAINLGSVILTLALVWVGFKFVAARGNEEAIKKAKTALMWTVIGGLILLGATAIQAVITSTVSSLTS